MSEAHQTSLHILFNDPCRSDLGLIGVLSRGTQGPPLPQEIPALIEFYLDAAYPIVIGQQLLFLKRVFQSDGFSDPTKDCPIHLVLHVSSRLL